MRTGLMAAVLSMVLAAPAAAERSAAARVYVHGAGAGTHGVSESVEVVNNVI
jgi:hypothetical protein